MSINSRYTDTTRAREMAATSSHPYNHRGGAAATDGEEDEDPYRYSSSSDEEPGMAGPEADTRRLIDPRHDADYPGPFPAASDPQLARGIAFHGQPHLPGGPHGNVGGHYGSVSSSVQSHGRNKMKWKRYRLPFLILLFFDCGLVIFLSIISYDSKVS